MSPPNGMGNNVHTRTIMATNKIREHFGCFCHARIRMIASRLQMSARKECSSVHTKWLIFHNLYANLSSMSPLFSSRVGVSTFRTGHCVNGEREKGEKYANEESPQNKLFLHIFFGDQIYAILWKSERRGTVEFLCFLYGVSSLCCLLSIPFGWNGLQHMIKVAGRLL